MAGVMEEADVLALETQKRDLVSVLSLSLRIRDVLM